MNENQGGLLDVEELREEGEAYRSLRLITRRGAVRARRYGGGDLHRGVIWVGGVGGGWDTPARGLYPRLCEELLDEGIASLRVQYRDPRVLDEAVSDVRAGVSYLMQEGIDAVGLVGHSLGGAVVIQVAAAFPVVRTGVALSTQSYGAAPAAQLGPQCSLLLVHGVDDPVLPVGCSEQVHRLARNPKRLVRIPGAGHGLIEAAEEVHDLVRDWLTTQLAEERNTAASG